MDLSLAPWRHVVPLLIELGCGFTQKKTCLLSILVCQGGKLGIDMEMDKQMVHSPQMQWSVTHKTQPSRFIYDLTRYQYLIQTLSVAFSSKLTASESSYEQTLRKGLPYLGGKVNLQIPLPLTKQKDYEPPPNIKERKEQKGKIMIKTG